MSHSILAIDLRIHVFWLPLLILLSLLAGLLFRSTRLKKARKQILSLETEMMNNHAEILQLQQKIVLLEKQSGAANTPVVPLKEQPAEEKNDKPDVSQHKKASH